ncbi:hypothetical protein [Rufibacter quisquiliarum]|uniref:Uncharacterized protein n=1 Tax=Rufibacter quisquiliarum TaxID=1549639 RepID=A0A839GM44_9BACT|nr:hypothetical protein [Rufibacter quisquiliarum]MBA9076007.1 hypothetical protein [Rufibacter quisquiliarum]
MSVIIDHVVNAGALKINNGGTMYVNRHLIVDQLTLHGPSSRIYVAAGAVLEAAEINGNWENVIYEEPLPVTWLEFSCKSDGKAHSLSWATAQEVNNDYIALEYATHDLVFKEITRQAGTNTASPAYYSFTHAFPVKGTSYYRLKQVDYDGKATYSKIISGTFHAFTYQLSASSLQMNTPVTGSVSLIRTDGTPAVEKVLNKEDLLRFPSLPAGMYMLRIESPQYKGLHKVYLRQ